MVSSLRFVILTPLVVTRLTEVEIAAWYLFGSLNFFGEMIQGRLGVSFSRMFAYGMSGADDLSPIRRQRTTHKEMGPNWSVLERAYGTIGRLNLFTSFTTFGVALILGWFALGELASGKRKPVICELIK